MALSKTEIANLALIKVGEDRVSNIETDTRKPAETINEIWDVTRDALLQSYPWNFAIKRASIAKNSSSPAWGYDNAYPVPSDFLGILHIYGDPDYKMERFDSTLSILTDEGSPLKIKYISKITSTGDFDPLFCQALASDLAVEVCEALTQSNTKKELLLQERERVIKRAYMSDAIQDPPQSLQEDDWILARENFISDDEIDYSTTS